MAKLHNILFLVFVLFGVKISDNHALSQHIHTERAVYKDSFPG